MPNDPRHERLLACADSWREHLTRSGGVTFAKADDKRRYVMAAGSQILKWFGMGTGDFLTMLNDVSFTLPAIPLAWEKPVVLLASRLEDDPVGDVETSTHEWTHGRDLSHLYKDAGPLPAEVNYCLLYGGTKEARARCEGKAYTSGLYARWRLTGRLFTPAEVVDRTHRIYAFGDEDFDLIEDMARSDVKSIERAEAPPHFTAIEFGGWIEDTYPDLIVGGAP